MIDQYAFLTPEVTVVRILRDGFLESKTATLILFVEKCSFCPTKPLLYIYKTLGLLPVQVKNTAILCKGVWVMYRFRMHSSKWQSHLSRC